MVCERDKPNGGEKGGQDSVAIVGIFKARLDMPNYKSVGAQLCETWECWSHYDFARCVTLHSTTRYCNSHLCFVYLITCSYSTLAANIDSRVIILCRPEPEEVDRDR